MKVIKTEPDPSVVKRKVCYNCGATLEYVLNDVKRGSHTDYTGSSDSYDYITCANCNKTVEL